MKTVIYYFSSTGNSLAVAQDLAGGLGAQVIPMAKVLKSADAAEFERVGFVFPVYMFGMPLLAADFLKAVKINPQAYVFCVITNGGLPGLALSQAKEILKTRGILLSAGFSILMPGNYTPLYGALSIDRQQKIFARAKIRVLQILELLGRRVKGRMEESPYLLNFLINKLVYRAGSARIRLSAKGLWAAASCNGCGTCVKVCPEKNISLQNNRPAWSTHCQHCLACLQWCPAQAIEYKNLTAGKKRYHHPAVTAQMIAHSGE